MKRSRCWCPRQQPNGIHHCVPMLAGTPTLASYDICENLRNLRETKLRWFPRKDAKGKGKSLKGKFENRNTILPQSHQNTKVHKGGNEIVDSKIRSLIRACSLPNLSGRGLQNSFIRVLRKSAQSAGSKTSLQALLTVHYSLLIPLC
jgi:hypothetical protein